MERISVLISAKIAIGFHIHCYIHCYILQLFVVFGDEDTSPDGKRQLVGTLRMSKFPCCVLPSSYHPMEPALRSKWVFLWLKEILTGLEIILCLHKCHSIIGGGTWLWALVHFFFFFLNKKSKLFEMPQKLFCKFSFWHSGFNRLSIQLYFALRCFEGESWI